MLVSIRLTHSSNNNTEITSWSKLVLLFAESNTVLIFLSLLKFFICFSFYKFFYKWLSDLPGNQESLKTFEGKKWKQKRFKIRFR